MSVEKRMQDAAEARLVEVEDAFWALESSPDDPELRKTVGLFCGGCHTCYVREVLEAAMPVLLAAIRSGEYADDTEVLTNVHHFPGAHS